MDLWSFDNVKAEKASAMRRYNRLRTIARLFRLVELCIAAVFLSWNFARLPFVLRTSRDYLCLFSGIVSSPLFVFLVCNAIIVSLFAKSRHVSTASAGPLEPKDDMETRLYDEFAENCSGKVSSSGSDVVSSVKEEVVYQDKQIITEVMNAADPKPETDSDSGAESESELESDLGLEFLKPIRRTKSEKFERFVPAKLKRSDTEVCRKMLRSGEEALSEDCDLENDLSNEEFQRAIEAFIEKQKRFRHQEVSRNCASKPELIMKEEEERRERRRRRDQEREERGERDEVREKKEIGKQGVRERRRRKKAERKERKRLWAFLIDFGNPTENAYGRYQLDFGKRL